ncbi:NAD(P)-dependent oxidoreductase [Streptomyces sp. NPDC046976]|uniref:NAD(P)-dependent oxidoreductase n=1 Tax=Streptomyces sp. NPDC046976 TaxID=3155258 RepID=UPI0033E69856
MVHTALTDELLRLSLPRLRSAFGPSAELRPWQEAPERDGVLLMAPHELSAGRRAEVLRSARWSWVHLTSAGADFIDLAEWPADTLLTRSWRCYAAPLAEYALHAVLTHEWRRGAPWQERDTRSAAAPDTPPVPAGSGTGGGAGLWGAEVTVAGWGAVGQRLATVLDALGARVTVLRRSPEPGSPFRQTSDLGRALDADHLVVALPLTAGTRHLFDRAALGRARPGLHLVNVSRAAIVDQDALTELCATGRLFATLDVTEPEPLPTRHPLRSLPTVRLSPHVAWRSRDSDAAFADDFATIWATLAASNASAAPDPSAAAGSSADPHSSDAPGISDASAPGVPVPAVPVPGAPVPGVPVPAVPAPGVPVPAVPVPAVPVPGASTPGVPMPAVPAPGVPVPAAPAPGVPASDAPALDAVIPGLVPPTSGRRARAAVRALLTPGRS